MALMVRALKIHQIRPRGFWFESQWGRSYAAQLKIVRHAKFFAYIDGSRAVCRIGLNYRDNLSK